MKSLKPLLVVTGLAVIGYALVRYYKQQINFLKDITYQVVGIKVVKVGMDNISLDITNRIYNASNVEATIKEMYLDFTINGIKVGNVNDVKDIVVLPAKTTDATYRFSFDPRLVLGNLVNLVTLTIAAKDMTFEAKGYVKVESGFIKTTIPFEYKNNFKSLIK
jgi:LEA14-like dessication related protein